MLITLPQNVIMFGGCVALLIIDAFASTTQLTITIIFTTFVSDCVSPTKRVSVYVCMCVWVCVPLK